MKALTIHRPWTDAIAYFPIEVAKRVENRVWSPPRAAEGTRIAIHAGKRYDADGAEDITDLLHERQVDRRVPSDEESPVGVVGTARLLGVVRPGRDGEPRYSSGVLVAPDLEWWTGDSIGWVLDEVVGIPAVACNGRQGLWVLPPSIAREVEVRVAAVRAGELDWRPRAERYARRQAELRELRDSDPVAYSRRCTAQGYRFEPLPDSLAGVEIDYEERAELQGLAERRAGA